MKRIIKLSIFVVLGILLNNKELIAQSPWSLTGNSGTSPSTNYVGTSDNQPLVFRTNATESMRLLTSGRLGIGTTTPSYPLQVGTVVSAGNLSSGGTFGVAIANGTSSVIGEQSTDKHAVFGSLGTDKDILFPTYNGTSFDERMRITGAGNVGIGITNPQRRLVVSNSGAEGVELQYFSGYGQVIAYNRNTSAYIPLILQDANSAGKVGIGTTTPASRLDVEGGVAIGATYSGTTAAPTNGAIIEGTLGIGTSSPSTKLHVVSNAGTFRLQGSDHTFIEYYPDGVTTRKAWMGFGAASDNNFTITNEISGSHIILSPTAGNVGIGTASPSYKLDVYTNTASGALRGLNSTTSGGNYGGYFGANGSGAATNTGIYATASGATQNIGILVAGPSSASGNFAIYSASTATSYFNGIVGIGVVSPSYMLTINGDGMAFGGDWYPSDQQFKTDIDSLQNALATIKQLKPKTYYFDTANVWGLNFSNKKQYGFLAQELEQVLPDVIKTSTKEEDIDTLGNVVHPAVTFKAVNYTEFIAILTKGIQELEQKNDSLKTEITNQNALNSLLQEQVNQLIINSTSTQEQLNQLLDKVNNCCSAPTRSMYINSDETQSQQTDIKLSDTQSLVLQQNVPNPFKEKTTINYVLPETYSKAELLFYSSQGKLIKSAELQGKGNGQLNVFADDLSNGVYSYTLVIDNKIVETKRMIKQ